MKKMKSLLSIILITVLLSSIMLISGGVVYANPNDYPSYTKNESNDGVSIEKTARWMNDKNKAEVTLTVDGLENTEQVSAKNDILFILDTSGSMASAGWPTSAANIRPGMGCVNSEHRMYQVFRNVPPAGDLRTWLDAEIISRIGTDIQIISGGAANYTRLGAVIEIDPALQIKIPESYYDINYGPFNSKLPESEFYLVPMLSSLVVRGNTLGILANSMGATWAIIDTARPMSMVDPITLSLGHNYYHTDENGERIWFELPHFQRANETDILPWPTTYYTLKDHEDIAMFPRPMVTIDSGGPNQYQAFYTSSTNIERSLIVGNVVAGDDADINDTFQFKITLKNRDGVLLTNDVSYNYYSAPNGALGASGVISNGEATLPISPDQYINTATLPFGTQYEVEQLTTNGYTTVAGGTSGTMTGTAYETASFANFKHPGVGQLVVSRALYSRTPSANNFEIILRDNAGVLLNTAQTFWRKPSSGPAQSLTTISNGWLVSAGVQSTSLSTGGSFVFPSLPNDTQVSITYSNPDSSAKHYNNLTQGVYYDDLLYRPDGVPVGWAFGEDRGCYQRINALYNSVNEFTRLILEGNPDNRVAFAAFNTRARGVDINGLHVESQGYLDFTSDYSTFVDGMDRVAPYAGQGMMQESVSGRARTAATNYQAGMLSGEQILLDDFLANGSNNHNKYVVFVSDGYPTAQVSAVSGGPASMPLVDSWFGSAVSRQARTDRAKEVADRIIDDYDVTIHGICMFETDLQPISQYVGQFVNGEIYETNFQDPTNIAQAYNDMFEELLIEISSTTKITTIGDTIDGRYFTIDKAALAANVSNAYYPAHATYQINVEEINGVSCEVITFDFWLSEGDTPPLSETVTIPLLLRSDADASGTHGFAPTNYDSSSTEKGAWADYKDLNGDDQSVHTPKTWLPTGSVLLKKIDDVTEQPLTGATFKLYYADGTLYSDTVYSLSAAGNFIRHTLPPGSYYFKEVGAPPGYIADIDTEHGFMIEVPTDIENPLELVVRNTPESFTGLVLHKTFVGTDIPEDAFTFVVTKADLSIEGTYTVSGPDAPDEVQVIADGEVLLKAGQTAIISNMIPGDDYQIAEIDSENIYVTTHKVNGVEADGKITSRIEIVDGTFVTVEFINTKEDILSPDTISVKATKVWDDDNNPARPRSIVVQLLKDGMAYGNPIALDARNGWTYTWDSLEKDAVWSVDEIDVPDGYAKSISGNTTDGFVITNKRSDRDGGQEPEPPTDPVVPEPSPTKPSAPSAIPRAGDSTPMLPMAMLSIFMGCVMITGVAVYKKRLEDQDL